MSPINVRCLCIIFCILFFCENLCQISEENIFDVNVVIIPNKVEEVIQLKVAWKDNITTIRNNSFNVIVYPNITNSNHCLEKSCAEYGFLGEMQEILIPEFPMPELELSSRDCSIQPGCSYTVKIETTKGSINKTISVVIPECIFDDCACEYGFQLPTTNVTTNLVKIDTLQIHWSLVPFSTNVSHILDKIIFSVHEHSNSMLSWGGTREVVGDQLIQLNRSQEKPKSGDFELKLQKFYLPGAVYTIKSHVVDVDNCFGPEKITTFSYNITKTDLESTSNDFMNYTMTKFSIVAGIITIMGTLLAYCIIRATFKKKVTEKNIPLLHIDIPMAQNCMYVDKDLQEALDNGMADLFEIPQNLIALGTEIGSGAFGQVYSGTLRNYKRSSGNLLVAVKKLKENPSEYELEEFFSEIQTMKNAGRHENIVAFLGCCTINSPLMMVMEYVGRGDLLKYLRTVREKVELYQLMRNARIYSAIGLEQNVNQTLSSRTANYLELKCERNTYSKEQLNLSGDYTHDPRSLRPSETETQYTFLSNSNDLDRIGSNHAEYISAYALDIKELHYFALQICKGMCHLEKIGIIHRDLAARNILIDENKTLKISDFGLSRKGIYINTKGTKLPLRWLSTEAILEKFYSNKSDVWSFGVVLWEIGSLGAIPYAELSNRDIVTFLVTGSRLEKPGICTDELYELMLNCWNEDLQERPSFAQILNWLQPLRKSVYVDISSLSDDYVFPPTVDTTK